MKKRSLFILTAIVIFTLNSISCVKVDPGSPDEVAVLETSYGRIVIEFFPDEAPRHVANFKNLAREGFFDGTKIHRVVKEKGVPVAIQGGDPNTINGDPATWGQGQPNQPKVPAEFSNTRRHVRGIVSAARRGDDIDSHTSQFFICDSSYPPWDRQYSIFGQVIEGLNVVDSISRAPVWKDTDRPMDPVVVSKVYITRKGDLK
jgi:cyclophilin family peptidyl-prolyl cis-trans isomerase